MTEHKIALVLGIRPDIIRTSQIIKRLDADPEVQLLFIWSGQHYSDNLKDIFFRELGVRAPDIELGCSGSTDAEIVSKLIERLAPVLERERPQALIYLGDTNTVASCICAVPFNIPIVHIEGCMRSYDWRMPEEKYRTLIDHLSDIIYTYLPSYRDNGIAEGIDPKRIVVTGNPIVEVLQDYLKTLSDADISAVLDKYGLERKGFILVTSHRRENVTMERPLREILRLMDAAAPTPILFAAGYRTQGMMKQFGLAAPAHAQVTDPLGYKEFVILMGAAKCILTDSGTVVEEACVLGVPTVQMRKATERPETYEVGASIRFDPAEEHTDAELKGILEQAMALDGKWPNPFGDGRASERIAQDILARAKTTFKTHEPDMGSARVRRAFYGGGT